MTRLVVALAGLVAGFLIGRGAGGAAHAPLPATPSTPRVETASLTPVRCLATLGTDDVDRIRDQILAGLHDRQPVATTSAAPAPAEPESGPEAVAAERSAGEVLQRAIAAGTWSQQDALSYRRLMGALTPEARNEAMSALTMAINRQELALTGAGPPI